jgi:hypothetical protein
MPRIPDRKLGHEVLQARCVRLTPTIGIIRFTPASIAAPAKMVVFSGCQGHQSKGSQRHCHGVRVPNRIAGSGR